MKKRKFVRRPKRVSEDDAEKILFKTLKKMGLV